MTELSAKTLETYANSIKRLESITDAEFNDHKAITDAIEGSRYAASSKNLMYCALLRQTINGMAQQAYKAMIQKYKDARNAKADDQTPTEEQKAKFVPWSELVTIQAKAKEEMDTHPHDKEYAINYLIVCLYTMTEPMRVDYNDMKIMKGDKLIPANGNLCVLKKQRGYFLFREFKTEKAIGSLQVEMPPALLEVVRAYVTKYTPTYLLTTKNGEPMTEATLSARIINVFSHFTGKKVGVTMIRHAWSSEYHKNSPALKEQKQKAKNMGHSVIQNSQYRFLDNA